MQTFWQAWLTKEVNDASVNLCTLDGTGDITCTVTAVSTGYLATFYPIWVDLTSTFVYMTSVEFDDRLYRCPINPNGLFGTCSYGLIGGFTPMGKVMDILVAGSY